MMMMIVPIIRYNKNNNNNQRSNSSYMMTKIIILLINLLYIINFNNDDHNNVRFVESFTSSSTLSFVSISNNIQKPTSCSHSRNHHIIKQQQQKSLSHICKCTNTKMMTTTTIASLAMTSAVLLQPILLSSRRQWNKQKASSLSLAKRIWPLMSGSNNNDDDNNNEDDSNMVDDDDNEQRLELNVKEMSISKSNNIKNNNNNNPTLLQETSKILQRTSFIAWWSQIILTTIASIILLFAQSISTNRNPLMISSSIMKWYSPRYILSTLGIITSTFSILWTWGNGNRLSKRIINPNKILSNIKVANMLRRSVRVGIIINLIGLLLHLLAGQEIIGKLAIKVLTLGVPTMYNNAATASASAILDNTLQPIDILVVQANNNSLLSHFISLTCHLYLTNIIKKLDPSSSSSTSNDN